MYKKVLIFIIIILGIFLRFKVEDLYYNKLQNNQKISGIFYVKSFGEEKEYKSKYKIKFNGVNYYIYLNKNANLKYGDCCSFEGYFSEFKGQRNFKGFDYKEYKKQDRIAGIIEIESFNKKGSNKDFFYYIFTFRERIKNRLYEKYEEKEASFLSGILLGDKTGIDDETKNNFRDASLSHILAISGMHVLYVVTGLRFILSKIINSRRKQNYFLICFLILFAIFTGSSPSVLRACIMMIISIIAELTFNETDFTRSLIFSLIIIFLINPYSIFSVGLWLSFFATLGLGKIRIKAIETLNVPLVIKQSFYANILIMPIIWHMFHTISFTFLVSNFLVRLFYSANINCWLFFNNNSIFKYSRKCFIKYCF